MSFALESSLFVVALFVGMLLMLEVGRRLGARLRAKLAQGGSAGIGAVEAAVFGLLGLLIAFTFQGAAARFDGRRTLIVQEANNIGTAWLRIDLMPPTAQPEMRELFRRYVDSRLATYRKASDIAAVKAELANSVRLQNEIWQRAIAADQEPGSKVAIGLLPSLNAMFDIVNTRTAVTKTHPPNIVFIMLTLLSLTSALFAGHGMSGAKVRSWVHIIGFAAVLALTVYVIIDLEYPRLGLIRVDEFDQFLVEVRKSMN